MPEADKLKKKGGKILRENMYQLKCTLDEFFPVLAIKMAEKENATRSFINETFNITQEHYDVFENDPLFKSMLSGVFTDNELERYRKIYRILKGAVTDQKQRRKVFNAWKNANPEIIQEITEMQKIENKRVIDLGVYFCMRNESLYAINSLCAIALMLDEGYSFEANLFMTVLFYGEFFANYAKDCDVDTDIPQFFSIPNSIVLRKHLLNEMRIKQAAYADTSSPIPFEMEYMMEDIFIKIAINYGINPNIIRSGKCCHDEFNMISDDPIKKRYSVRDRCSLTQEEDAILDKIKTLLPLLLQQNNTSMQPYSAEMKQPEEIEGASAILESSEDETIEIYHEQTKRIQSLLKELKSKDLELKKVKKVLEEKEQQCKDLMLEKTVLHKTILDMFDSTEDCLEYELTEEIMKTLYDTKGVIVGGHRNLINKLLKYLPQWTVIEVDRGVKNNWGALRAATLIIMNTEYISHGLYNQAMGNINEKKNIIFNRKNNIEKILREIYIKVSA